MKNQNYDPQLFRSELWYSAEDIYEAILTLPFLTQLAEGTLSPDIFNAYIAQDELYLGNYGRHMFTVVDRMEDPEEREFFRSFAIAGLEGEKVMHSLLIERFGNDLHPEPSPVTRGYNEEIDNAVSNDVVEVGMASLLPCAWVYNRVGLEILKKANLDNNPYREWILEYGNDDFTAQVNRLVDIVALWASRSTPEVRQRMKDIFRLCCFWEYKFWQWPCERN